MNPENESVLVFYTDSEEAIAIVKRDNKSKKTIFYSLQEMGKDEIESLFKKNGTHE